MWKLLLLQMLLVSSKVVTNLPITYISILSTLFGSHVKLQQNFLYGGTLRNAFNSLLGRGDRVWEVFVSGRSTENI